MPFSDPAGEALHARARAFVAAYEAGLPMPESFDALGADLARYQAERTSGYAKLCRARGVDLGAGRLAAFPAVPTDTFKLTRVSTFPVGEEAVVFRTSGTTVGARGEHAFRDVGTYDRGAVAFGRTELLTGIADRLPVLVLGPSPRELPDSSLTHMIQLFVERFGTPASEEETYFVRDGILELPAFDERAARLLTSSEPVLLLGTSFAFVHFLDALDGASFRLPEGSRVMQTGGFKGKSREVDAATLRSELAAAFFVPQTAIVGEYGMTELSSQFYEGTLRDGPRGVYREPPWARVVPVDPDTLAPVPHGEVGLARIEDLLNVDSAVVVLAQDRVRRVDGGFELLGRWPGAAPRGCSLAIEEMLSS